MVGWWWVGWVYLHVHVCVWNVLPGVGASSDLMPVTEQTSRALLGQGAGGRPTPTFPSFLPLEVFDDTEYDCRTPQEWLEMGKHMSKLARRIMKETHPPQNMYMYMWLCHPHTGVEDGVRKPVPGKALLPVLDPPSPTPLPSPTPPTTLPPSHTHTRHTRMSLFTLKQKHYSTTLYAS